MNQNELEVVVDPVDPVITIRRVVNAPRPLVWDCFTKPEHIRRWKGPKDVEMVVCECDVRPGGKWRALYRRPNGDEFGFHGVFREVVAPERFVRTFVMSAAAECVETLVLTEAGPDKTLITTKNLYQSMAIRDSFVQHGSAASGKDMYLRLDELLASLATRNGTAAQTTA